MTPTEHRRLRRLLQRERQKGVVAFDQVVDLATRTAEMAPGQSLEGADHDRAGADRGADHWERQLHVKSAR